MNPRPICAFLFVFLAFFSTGCVRSIQPILKDNQLTIDNAIAGKWTPVDGRAVAEITPSSITDKSYDLRYTEENGKVGLYKLRLGKVGPLLIAEIHPQTTPLDTYGVIYKVHFLPLYSFFVIQSHTDQKIELLMLQPEWLWQYIKDHPADLPANAESKKDITLNATTDQIQSFLLAHIPDKEKTKNVWGDKPGIFIRPGDPTTQPATK